MQNELEFVNEIINKFNECDLYLENFIISISPKKFKKILKNGITSDQSTFYRALLSFRESQLYLLEFLSLRKQRPSNQLKEEIQEFLFNFVRWKNIYQWWINHNRPNEAKMLDGVKLGEDGFSKHFRFIAEFIIQIGDMDILETLFSSAQFLGSSELNFILAWTLDYIKKNQNRIKSQNIIQESRLMTLTFPIPLIGLLSEFVNDEQVEGGRQIHSLLVELLRKKVYAIIDEGKNANMLLDEDVENLFYSDYSEDDLSINSPLDDLVPIIKYLMQISHTSPRVAEDYFALMHDILVKVDDRSIIPNIMFLIDMQLRYSKKLRNRLSKFISHLYSATRNISLESINTPIWHATNLLLILTISKNELIKTEGLKLASFIVNRVRSISQSENVGQTFSKIFQYTIQRCPIICELFLELCIHWCQNSFKDYKDLKEIGELGIYSLFTYSPDSRREILGTVFRIIQQHPIEEEKLLFVNIIGKIVSSEMGASVTDYLNVIIEGLSNLSEYSETVAKALLKIFIPQSMVFLQYKEFFMIYFTKNLLSRDSDFQNMSIYGLCQYFQVYSEISSAQREEYELSLLNSLSPLFIHHCNARHFLFETLANSIKTLTSRTADTLFLMIETNLKSIIGLKMIHGQMRYVLDFNSLCTQTKYSSSIEPICPIIRLLLSLHESIKTPSNLQRINNIFIDIFEQITTPAWIQKIFSKKDKKLRLEAMLSIIEEYLELINSNHIIKGYILQNFPLAQNILFELFTTLTLHTTINSSDETSTLSYCKLSTNTTLCIYFDSLQTLFEALDLEFSNEIDQNSSHVCWTALEVIQALRFIQNRLPYFDLDMHQKLFDSICGSFLESCRIPFEGPFGYQSDSFSFITKKFCSGKQSSCFSSRKWTISRLKTLSLRILQQILDMNDTIKIDYLYHLVETDTKNPASLFSALVSEFQRDLITNRANSDEVGFLNFLEHFANQYKDIILTTRESEQATKHFLKIFGNSSIRTRMRKILVLLLEFCPLSIRNDCICLLIDGLIQYEEVKQSSKGIIKNNQMYDCGLKTLLQFSSFCPPGLSIEHLRDIISLCNKSADDIGVVSKLERALSRICGTLTKQLRLLDVEMKITKSKNVKHLIGNSISETESISSQTSKTIPPKDIEDNSLSMPYSHPQEVEEYSYFAKYCVQVAQVAEQIIAAKYSDSIYFVASSLIALVENYNKMTVSIREYCSDIKYIDQSKEYRVLLPTFRTFDEKILLNTRKRKKREKELRKKQVKMVKKAKRLRSMDEGVDVDTEEINDTYSDLKSFIVS